MANEEEMFCKIVPTLAGGWILLDQFQSAKQYYTEVGDPCGDMPAYACARHPGNISNVGIDMLGVGGLLFGLFCLTKSGIAHWQEKAAEARKPAFVL